MNFSTVTQFSTKRSVLILMALILLLVAGVGSASADDPFEGSGYFTHVVNSYNLSDSHTTVISHPSINGDAAALLFVTQKATHRNRMRPIYPSPLAVRYDHDIERWTLVGLGVETLGEHMVFTIRETEMSGSSSAYLHLDLNPDGASTMLDYPALNDNPNAIFQVTHNIISGAVNNSNVATEYNEELGRWFIVNQDGQAMPDNVVFNVRVPLFSEESQLVFGNETTLSNDESSIYLSHNYLNDNENAVFWTSPVRFMGEMDYTTALSYDQDMGRWTITRSDDQSMAGDGFNIIMPATFTLNLSTQHLNNGSFEQPNEVSNKIPAYWTAKNLSKDKRKCNKPAKDKYFSAHGDCAFQLKAVPGVKSQLKQKVVLNYESPFAATLSARVRGKNLTSGLKIMAVLKTEDGGKGKVILDGQALNNGTYEYTEFSNTLDMGPQFTQAKIKLQIRNGTGKAFIDDVQFTTSTNMAMEQEADLLPLPAAPAR